MRSIKQLISISFIGIIIHSCTPSYIPNMVNAPLFTSQGEVQITASTGSSGIDGQLAYAVTDNFGIMLNGSYSDKKDTAVSFRHFHYHDFIEFGAGYTTPIGKSQKFEIFGGGGVGNVDSYYNSSIYYGRANARLTRFFLQPCIGSSNDVFDGGFTPRIVFVKMDNPFVNESYNTFETFIEPTFTAKVGWKYIKMVFQIGVSFPASRPVYFGHQPLMFSFGLMGKIPGKDYGNTRQDKAKNRSSNYN